MPRKPTYPTSSLELRDGATSVVRFHCQLLARFGFTSKPRDGEPPTAKSNMLTLLVKVGPSSVRSGPTPTVNGGLEPTSRVEVPLIGSRAKNCPTPPRSTSDCLPLTSHANPRRGANRW